MINSSTSAIYKRFTYILVVLVGLSLLAGCGSSSSSKDKQNADPKGFYTGTASIKEADDTTDLMINDLEGMVSGNRFMFLSVDEVLLYDGRITAVNGNDYTATVEIYEDGVLSTSTTVSGTITEGSSISGTFAGAGAGNGTFTLTYSQNNAPSDLARIGSTIFDPDKRGWVGPLNGASGESSSTFITRAGEVSRTQNFSSSTPVLRGCDYDSGSTVLAIADVNVYEVSITLSGCTDDEVNGTYSGFATTQTATDSFLVLAYSNGSYSGSGDLDVD